jgi:hypothetical protein
LYHHKGQQVTRIPLLGASWFANFASAQPLIQGSHRFPPVPTRCTHCTSTPAFFSVVPYRIVKSNLARKVQPFLRRGTATQHCLLAVKVLGDFLKRSVARLNVEEVHRDQSDAEPTTIKDVVFPSKGINGNRIDVLVEEDLMEKRSV